MREIVITPRRSGDSAPLVQQRYTVLGHGLTGSGKTRFMATMPKPLIIAAGDESGWTTIQTMDPQLFHDPKIPPRVLAIDSVADLPIIMGRARQMIAAKEIESIGFDSATFYGDLYLNWLKVNNPGKDNRQIYGDFGAHMRDVRINVHGLPVNVMWSALTTTPDKEDATDLARPMIPGKEGDKFAAACDFVLYFVQQSIPPKPGQPASIRFEIRTRRYGKAIARGRDSGILPDPLRVATWREMMDLLKQGILAPTAAPPTDEELAAAGEAEAAAAPAPAAVPSAAPTPPAVRPVVVPPRPVARPVARPVVRKP